MCEKDSFAVTPLGSHVHPGVSGRMYTFRPVFPPQSPGFFRALSFSLLVQLVDQVRQRPHLNSQKAHRARRLRGTRVSLCETEASAAYKLAARTRVLHRCRRWSAQARSRPHLLLHLVNLPPPSGSGVLEHRRVAHVRQFVAKVRARHRGVVG